MPLTLRTFTLAAALLVAAPLPALAGETPDDTGSSSPETTEAAESEADALAFPLPVVAPVLVPEDSAAPLAVTSYGLGSGGDTVVVHFAEPFELPDAFRYRVEFHVGDPGGERQRISFIAESGEQSAIAEEGDGVEWDEIGGVEAVFVDDVLSLGLPDDLEVDDDSVAWLEVSLIREDTGGDDRFATPLVPALDLLDPEEPVLHTAPQAWGSVEQPPAPPVRTGAGPTVRIEGDELILEYSEPVPTEVSGERVEKVTDVVRIAPDYGAEGGASFLVFVDHAEDTVTLRDATSPLLAEVPNDDLWLIEGIPTRGVDEGDQIRVSVTSLLQALDITSAEIEADNRVAFGVARQVQVGGGAADDGGFYRSDGMLGTAAWFAGTAFEEAGPVTTTAPGPRAAGNGEGGRSRVLTIVVVVCVIALLGTTAYLTVRYLDHRRRMRATGPVITPRPAPEPTEEERERLDEFTRQLFGGGRKR
jgi:hypothetical protein